MRPLSPIFRSSRLLPQAGALLRSFARSFTGTDSLCALLVKDPVPGACKTRFDAYGVKSLIGVLNPRSLFGLVI